MGLCYRISQKEQMGLVAGMHTSKSQSVVAGLERSKRVFQARYSSFTDVETVLPLSRGV